MVDDYMQDKVSEKIKEIIVTKKFNHTKILIDTDNKLSDHITDINCDINYVRYKR